MREHDLILMTTEKLNLPGRDNDLKKSATIDFLRSVLFRSCAMFGFVTGKNMSQSKSGMNVDGGALELLVDYSKACFLSMEERAHSYTRMYVYLFDSLATTMREYQTIRKSEFYAMSDILL